MKESRIGFNLDEDVSDLVAEILRSQGERAITTTEVVRKGQHDDAQLQYATVNGLVIVTHNRNDFAVLAAKWFDRGQHHGGIVLAFRRPPVILAARLKAIVASYTAAEFADQVLYV